MWLGSGESWTVLLDIGSGEMFLCMCPRATTCPHCHSCVPCPSCLHLACDPDSVGLPSAENPNGCWVLQPRGLQRPLRKEGGCPADALRVRGELDPWGTGPGLGREAEPAEGM